MKAWDGRVLHGTKRLHYKESDRAKTIYEEFSKIGAKIELQENSMEIFGSEIKGGNTFSHGDHRIAMALATAAVEAKGAIEIENYECISKSYPNFFNDFEKLGGDVQ